MKAANFDLTDEFGRNLAFVEAEVVARTAKLTFDPGDGTVEVYQVAATGGRDTDFVVGGGLVGGYDEDGVALGIPLDFAMQDILGLTKNASETDAIIAGPNGIAESTAAGDDVQLIPTATSGLTDRQIIIRAGQNGILDSTKQGDDQEAITTGYETSLTCDENTVQEIIEPLSGGDLVANTTALAGSDDCQLVEVGEPVSAGETIIDAGSDGLLQTVANGDDEFSGPGNICDSDNDCQSGTCAGREVLVRLGNSQTGSPNRFWLIFMSDNAPAGAGFGDVLLQPGDAVTLAFGQDIDRDGLFAREELLYGSSDRAKDSDEDGIGDFAEIRVGWNVKTSGKSDLQVYPHPILEDSDFDGIGDLVELQCRTDPAARDTDEDGLSDCEELGSINTNGEVTLGSLNTNGECIIPDGALAIVCPSSGDFLPDDPPSVLDPRNPDTDGDGLLDGIEPNLCDEDDDTDCSNPLDPTDADSFKDTDDDGLTDEQEQLGWLVSIELCDVPGCTPSSTSYTAFPDPTEGDSDFDGLPDLLEKILGTDPLLSDTDQDGILDYDEFADFAAYQNLNEQYSGFFLFGAASQQIDTDPTSQDTDGDTLPDNFERVDGWRVQAQGDTELREVNSDPLYEDTDLDGLDDYGEYEEKTDPTDADTDDDGTEDGTEVDVGSDPLMPDVSFMVRLVRILEVTGNEDGTNGKNEWKFEILVRLPSIPGSSEEKLLTPNILECLRPGAGSIDGSCWKTDNDFLIDLPDRGDECGDDSETDPNQKDALATFALDLGTPFLVEGFWSESKNEDCGGGGDGSCFGSIQEVFNADDLLTEPFITRELQPFGGGSDCSVIIEMEIVRLDSGL